jgi:D-glycerate 3-kinase
MRRDAITQSGYGPAVVAATLDALIARMRGSAPHLAGLSGLQGSGKSTFAIQLANAANARGIATQILSLDDFYLGRRARLQLARAVHPLLATRGVPGTHDIGLLMRSLDALGAASPRHPARLPRFDKGRDTRLAPSRWRRVDAAPALVILEGWCVGVPAQAAAALRTPLNALERHEDRNAHWRRWVNAQLAGDYARLWARLDTLIVLQAPGFAVVSRWRDEQEHALRLRAAPHAMDAAALRRFLMHYERLSRHALATLPARADIRLLLGRNRNVRGIVDAAAAHVDQGVGRTGSTTTAVP